MKFLIRWSWLFVLGFIAAAIPAALLAGGTGSTYKSTVTVLVVNEPEASERLTNTYAGLVKVRPVLDQVQQRLSLTETDEELSKKITVGSDFNSQLIKIGVEDPDANRAAQIANTTADAMIRNSELLVGKPGTVRIAEGAEPAPVPSKSSVPARAAMAGGLGVLVALSIAIGVESLRSNRRESPEPGPRRDISPEPMS